MCVCVWSSNQQEPKYSWRFILTHWVFSSFLFPLKKKKNPILLSGCLLFLPQSKLKCDYKPLCSLRQWRHQQSAYTGPKHWLFFGKGGGRMHAGVNFLKNVLKKTSKVWWNRCVLFLQLLPRRTHVQCRENRNILQHLSGDGSSTLKSYLSFLFLNIQSCVPSWLILSITHRSMFVFHRNIKQSWTVC